MRSTNKSEVFKQSELHNRLVLDRHTAEEVGQVAHLILDPQAHRVAGLVCKSGFLGSKKRAYNWTQVESIGADSLMLNTSQGKRSSENTESNAPIDCEIWTDTGNKVGRLVDYLFESTTGTVINYLYSSNGWRGIMEGVYLLPPVAVSSIGSKRVIVLEASVQNPEHYTEGLNKRFNQAAQVIREDFENTRQDLQGIRQRAQNVGEQIQDRVQDVNEQVQERVTELKTRFDNKAEDDKDKPNSNS